MKPTAIVLALFIAHAASARGQSTSAFELADVHASPVTPITMGMPARGGVPRDGVYRIWQATMVDLIRMAYGVDADKISGGPHWLELDRFDIVAKVAPGTTRESAKPMLQALLAERFGLVVTRESKEFPVFALARGDGALMLKEAAAGTAPACQQSVRSEPGGRSPTMTATCQSTSMAALAQRVTNALSGRQVVDVTGMPGLWDFEVALPPPRGGDPDVKGVTDAILKSTGLKLEQRSMSLPVISVIRVNRLPTPNLPAVAAAFAAGPPPEFEVSVIKPSAPGAQPRRQILPSGQLTGTAVSVRQMLGLAYQLPDDAPILGPKALDAPLWDVVAKISSQALNPDETDIDAVSTMMRRLLAERFHLKARFEDRPTDAPTLVAAGTHRLTKSDPEARTRCTQSAAQSQSVPAMVFKCQNISLAEFADRLQRLDSQEFKMPVADQTGIDGRWDITLTFTPAVMLRAFTDGLNAGRAAAAAAQGGASGNSSLAASDPITSVSTTEAIKRQLGLKIEMRRRPVPVLVVESMDERPTDN